MNRLIQGKEGTAGHPPPPPGTLYYVDTHLEVGPESRQVERMHQALECPDFQGEGGHCGGCGNREPIALLQVFIYIMYIAFIILLECKPNHER